MIRKIAILLIINLLSAFILRGQSEDVRVLASAGSCATQGTFEVCYTLGEAIISSGNSANNVNRVTGGFQQPGQGVKMNGTIFDACSGGPLSNATVRIENPLDSVKTGADGTYAFELFSKNTAFDVTVYQDVPYKRINAKRFTGQAAWTNMKINLGKVVTTDFKDTICEIEFPYNYKGVRFLKKLPATYVLDTTITNKSNLAFPEESCDSVFNLSLRVEIAEKRDSYRVVCGQDTTLFTYLSRPIRAFSDGTFTGKQFYAPSKCDSVVTNLKVSFYKSAFAVDRQTACYGETLRYKGKTFTIQNSLAMDTVRGGAAYGCDSISQIVVTFERAKGIDDEFSFKLDTLLDTLIRVVTNDYISGNYKMTITDPPAVGTAKVGTNGTIRIKIPVTPVSELSFKYQLCSNSCPSLCSEATVLLKLSRNPNSITGGGGESVIITPNGDGMNDVLYFEGLDFFPNNSLTIVNRWGQQVYYARPYKNDWKGTNQTGQELPEGTYFYAVNFNLADRKVQWGSITIRK
jgi:gliding motility-associated-like protein